MADTSATAADGQVGSWLALIRTEYLEMPGLKLTLPQTCRLWRLDNPTGIALLAALVEAKFLRRTLSGTYVRGDTAPSVALGTAVLEPRHAASPVSTTPRPEALAGNTDDCDGSGPGATEAAEVPALDHA